MNGLRRNIHEEIILLELDKLNKCLQMKWKKERSWSGMETRVTKVEEVEIIEVDVTLVEEDWTKHLKMSQRLTNKEVPWDVEEAIEEANLVDQGSMYQVEDPSSLT